MTSVATKRRDHSPAGRRGPSLGRLLTVLFFSVQAVAPHAAESRFWQERRRAGDAQRAASAADAALFAARLPAPVSFAPHIPAAFPSADAVSSSQAALLSAVASHGDVRELHLSPDRGGPLVVHIQDAHEIEEAQRHIAAIITGLAAAQPGLTVGLEGAAGGFDTAAFRALPDADALRGVMGYFLKNGSIGGAEFAAITGPASIDLWGVEDSAAYAANVRAVRDAAPLKEAWRARWAEADAMRARAQARIYSPALAAFDRHARDYTAGQEGLGAHAAYLRPHAAGAFPQVDRFLRALKAEASLDFAQVERDRQRLAQVLADRLSPAEVRTLVRAGLAYRNDPRAAAGYHRRLKDLCAAHGLRWDSFGRLPAYVDYLTLSDGIDREALLAELPRLERAVEDALAATPDQKRLAAAGRRMRLLKKLSDQAMTPADWAEYLHERAHVLALPGELASLDGSASSSEVWDAALLAPFEDFCRGALARNEALAAHLLARAGRAPVAVLVAGGFHTEGLTHLLRQKGASYAVVTPRFTPTAAMSGNALDAFTRAPLPLEKLFAGEVISLLRWRFTASQAPDVSGAAPQTEAFRTQAAVLVPAVTQGARQGLLSADETAAALAAGRALLRKDDFNFGAPALRQGAPTLPFQKGGKDFAVQASRAALPPGRAAAEGDVEHPAGPVHFRVQAHGKFDVYEDLLAPVAEELVISGLILALAPDVFAPARLLFALAHRRLAGGRSWWEAMLVPALISGVSLAARGLAPVEAVSLVLSASILGHMALNVLSSFANERFGLRLGKAVLIPAAALRRAPGLAWGALADLGALLARRANRLGLRLADAFDHMSVRGNAHQQMLLEDLARRPDPELSRFVRLSNFGDELPEALLRMNVLEPHSPSNDEQVALAGALSAAFADAGAEGVQVMFHQADDTVKNTDLFLLAPFYHDSGGKPVLSFDLRLLRAFMVLDEERRSSFVRALARRSVRLRAGGEEAPEDRDEKNLVEWTHLFIVPILQVHPALPASVRKVLYLYAKQALTVSDDAASYTGRQLELMEGRPTLERMAHVLWHVVRVSEETRLAAQRWNTAHPEQALSATEVETLLIAAAGHDLGKFHPSLVHIFLSPRRFKPDTDDRRMLEMHEERSVSLIRELGFRMNPREEEILRLDSGGWKDVARAAAADPKILVSAMLLSAVDVYDGFRDQHRPYHRDWGPGFYPPLEEVQAELERKLAGLKGDPATAGLAADVLAHFRALHQDEGFVRSMERTFTDSALHALQRRVAEGGMTVEQRCAAAMEEVQRYALLTLRSPPSLWWPDLFHRGVLHGVPDRELTAMTRALAGALLSSRPWPPETAQALHRAKSSGEPDDLVLSRDALLSLLPEGDVTPLEARARRLAQAFFNLASGGDAQALDEPYRTLIHRRARMVRLEDSVLHLGSGGAILPLIDAALGARSVLVTDAETPPLEKVSRDVAALAAQPEFAYLRKVVHVRGETTDVDWLEEDLEGRRFDQIVMWNMFSDSAYQKRIIGGLTSRAMSALGQIIRKFRPQGRLWITNEFIGSSSFPVMKALRALERNGRFSLRMLPSSQGSFAGADADVLAYEISPPARSSVRPGDIARGFLRRHLGDRHADLITLFAAPLWETAAGALVLDRAKGFLFQRDFPDLAVLSWGTASLWAGLWLVTSLVIVLAHIPTDRREGDFQREGWFGNRLKQMLKLTAPLVFLPFPIGFLLGLSWHGADNYNALYSLDPAHKGLLPASVIPRGALLQKLRRARERGDLDAFQEELKHRVAYDPDPTLLAQTLLELLREAAADKAGDYADALESALTGIFRRNVRVAPPEEYFTAWLTVVTAPGVSFPARREILDSLLNLRRLFPSDWLERAQAALDKAKDDPAMKAWDSKALGRAAKDLANDRLSKDLPRRPGGRRKMEPLRVFGADAPLAVSVHRDGNPLREVVRSLAESFDAAPAERLRLLGLLMDQKIFPAKLKESLALLLGAPSGFPREASRRVNLYLLKRGFYLHVSPGAGGLRAFPFQVEETWGWSVRDRHAAVAHLQVMPGYSLRGVDVEQVLEQAPEGLAPVLLDEIRRDVLDVLLPALARRDSMDAPRLIAGDAAMLLDSDNPAVRKDFHALINLLHGRAAVLRRLEEALSGQEADKLPAFRVVARNLPLVLRSAHLDFFSRMAGGVDKDFDGDLASLQKSIKERSAVYEDLVDRLTYALAESREAWALARVFSGVDERGARAQARFTQMALSRTPGTDLVLWDAALRAGMPESEEQGILTEVFVRWAEALSGKAFDGEAIDTGAVLRDLGLQVRDGGVLQATDRFGSMLSPDMLEESRAFVGGMVAKARSFPALTRALRHVRAVRDARGLTWSAGRLVSAVQEYEDGKRPLDALPELAHIPLREAALRAKSKKRHFSVVRPRGLMSLSAAVYRAARGHSPARGAAAAFTLGVGEEMVVRRFFDSLFDFPLMLGPVGYAFLFATLLHFRGVFLADGTFKRIPWHDLFGPERRALWAGAMVLGAAGAVLTLAGLKPWQTYLLLGIAHGGWNIFGGGPLGVMNLAPARERILSESLSMVERAKVTRIVYPAGIGDDALLAALAKDFPNLKEIRVIDPRFMKGGERSEAWRPDGGALRLVEEKEDYLAQSRLPPMVGVTLFIDKYPGNDAYLRADPRYRRALLRDGRPGDLVLSLPASMNPALRWSRKLAGAVSVAGYGDRSGFEVWRMGDGDREEAAEMEERLAPVASGFPSGLVDDGALFLRERLVRLMRVIRSENLLSLRMPVEAWWPLLLVKAFALDSVARGLDTRLLRQLGAALRASDVLTDENLLRKARDLEYTGRVDRFSLDREELERLMLELSPPGEASLLQETLLGGGAASRTVALNRFHITLTEAVSHALDARAAAAQGRNSSLAALDMTRLAALHAREAGEDDAVLAERQRRDITIRLRAAGAGAVGAADAYNRAMGFEKGADVVDAAVEAKKGMIFEVGLPLLQGNPTDRDRENLIHLARALEAGAAVQFLLPRGVRPAAARGVLARAGVPMIDKRVGWLRKDDTQVDVGLHSVEKLLRLAQGEGELRPMLFFMQDRREWRVESRVEALAALILAWSDGWVRDVAKPLEDLRNLNLVVLTQA